jgi:D-alanyl-D-alanine carboxypeptidase
VSFISPESTCKVLPMKKQPLVFAVLWMLSACTPANNPNANCASAQPYRNPQALRSTPSNWTTFAGSIEGQLEPTLVTALEQSLERILMQSKATGVSAAVAVAGRGRWAAARGLAVKNPPRAFQTTDLFFNASIGKLVTGTLVLQLVESGQLALSTSIAKWFPDFPNAKVITIEHLLTHTSGVFSFERAGAFADGVYRTPEALIAYAKNQGNLFCPGAAWDYSNTGMIMLGRILEERYGQSMEVIIQKRIIEALGLKNTRVVVYGKPLPIVEGYVDGKVVTRDLSLPFAAGMIASNATDLLSILEGYVSGRLLQQKTITQATAKMYPSFDKGIFFGQGIMLYDLPLGIALGHSGGTEGYNAQVWYVPKYQAFIALQFNDQSPSSAGAFALLETLVGQK